MNSDAQQGKWNRLVLLRHGATTWTLEHRYNSRTDVPLAADGRQEIVELADTLSGESIDRIISSPLKRAVQSAEILADKLGKPISLDDDLVEVDFGPFEGRTHQEVMHSPTFELFRNWLTQSSFGSSQGMEPLDLAAVRAKTFCDKEGVRHGATLVVSHGVFLRVLLCTCVLGLNASSFGKLRIDTGALAELIRNDEDMRIACLNAKHLARERLSGT